jgi:LppX_LprAFG lipoprotein
MRRLVPVAIAALVLTLSGCGSGASNAAPTATGLGATRLIAASADKAAAAKTARMSGEVTIEVGGERRTLPLDGALDFGSGAFEFTYDMSQLGLPGAGDDAKIQARMVDGAMYMKLGGLGGALSELIGDRSWVKIDLSSLGLGSAGALGEANPGGTLDSLRGADDVERVGAETVRGVETTHYRATVDPRKALDRTPADLRDKISKALEMFGGPIPVDVWIDGDGQARKISMDITSETVNASTTIEYYDFGVEIDVSAPPPDDVFDISQLSGGMHAPTGGGAPAI